MGKGVSEVARQKPTAQHALVREPLHVYYVISGLDSTYHPGVGFRHIKSGDTSRRIYRDPILLCRYLAQHQLVGF